MRILLFILGAGILGYLLFAFIRFQYYVHKAQNLMNATTAASYTIKGGPEWRSIAILGDSTAAGTGASRVEKTYHYQFLEKYKDHYSFNVVNYGVVGARIADVASQLQRIKEPVDIIILSITGNDVTHSTPLDQVEKNLYKTLTDAHKKAKLVVLLTPGDLGDVFIVPAPIRWYWARKSSQMSALASRVANDTQTTHVDIYARKSPLFREQPHIYYAADYFHPSDEGYRLWAEALSGTVKLQ